MNHGIVFCSVILLLTCNAGLLYTNPNRSAKQLPYPEALSSPSFAFATPLVFPASPLFPSVQWKVGWNAVCFLRKV